MTKFFALLCVVVAVSVGCSKEAAKMPATATQQVKPVAFNEAKLPTVSISAPDMMCPDGCGVKVKEILSKQPGAKEVIVDFDNKTAIVAVEDEAKFDAKAAVADLADHGFKNSSLKGEGDAAAPAVEKAVEPAAPATDAKPADGATG